MAKDVKSKIKPVTRNRRARFDFDLLEKFEAGIVLRGSEVKSIREGRVSLNESYARAREGEFYVYNMDVAHYRHAGPAQHEPKRPRKLLLKKHEIQRLLGKTRERGLTLVPTSLYLKRGLVKLEIALGKGREKRDKRDAIRKRESDRELRRRTMR